MGGLWAAPTTAYKKAEEGDDMSLNACIDRACPAVKSEERNKAPVGRLIAAWQAQSSAMKHIVKFVMN